ncbi:MAG: hypothetical protein HW408_524 [Actinobacteria bacterium]|nr:hypothetical protein [Actinomycetota bacterium]
MTGLYRTLICLLLTLPLFCGCTGTVSSKNPSVADLGKDVETIARRMVGSLAEPMSRGDSDAVGRILAAERKALGAGRGGGLSQFIVLDRKGVVLVCDVPFVCDDARDYSRTDLVSRALKGKQGSHGKIYASNNKEMFLVLTPIPAQGEKDGLLGLLFDAETLARERKVTEKEFLAMKFSI